MFPFPSFSLEFEIEMTTWQARLWTGYSMTKANPKSPSWRRRRRATKTDSPWAQAFPYRSQLTCIVNPGRTSVWMSELGITSLSDKFGDRTITQQLYLCCERERASKGDPFQKKEKSGIGDKCSNVWIAQWIFPFSPWEKKEEEESFGQFKYQTSLSDGRELC